MKLGVLETAAADVAHATKMPIVGPEGVTLTANDGADERGDPIVKECYIEFLSADSDAGRKVERQRNTAQFRKMRSGRNTDLDDDPVDIQVEMLTALATGWYFGPDAEPFSRSGAKALFADPEYAWLRKQAYTYVYSAANFTRRSSKSSSPSPSGKPGSTASATTAQASGST